MNRKVKSVILWVVAVVLTISAAIYQRATGPTYPVSGTIELAGETIDYELIRSDETEGETEMSEIAIVAPNESIKGSYIFKRYKSYDTWTEKDLRRDGDKLIMDIPRQPMAGKVEYQITLTDGTEIIKLTEEPVIMRYKGVVPDFVLIPHILFMFLAMLFSTRAGIEAIFKGPALKNHTLWTLIFFLAGGLVLGPIVQKYAFDAYWTGWPWGTDLTDNKTIVAFLFWVLAFVMLRKNAKKVIYPIIASIVLMGIYMIPHSALGSEIDYTKLEEAPIENVQGQENQSTREQQEAEENSVME
jgi:hypothetical protein